MISLRRRGARQLDSMLAASRLLSPTYPEIGASRAANLPAGYHHVRIVERVGGSDAFDRAVEGLRSWVAHEGAGLRIYPPGDVSPGATVIAVTSLGPARMTAPCRVVTVFKETDVFGFAYGTLPGHPERGEESFVVERRDDGTYFTISAFSMPVDPLARLAGPLGRFVQRVVTRRYVDALRRFVTPETPTSDAA